MPKSHRATVTATFQRSSGTQTQRLTGGVSISRSYRGVRQDTGTVAEMVANALVDTIAKNNSEHFFKIPAPRLAMRIANRIDAELLKVGQFISTQLIGHPSGPPNGTTFIDKFEGQIEAHWKNLALRTTRTKTANKNRFFLHTGALRNDIRANVGAHLVAMNSGISSRSSAGVVTHGPVRIRPYYYDPHNKRVYKIAEIEINLLAKSRANRIASIINEDIFDDMSTTRSDIEYLARKLGLNSDSVDKLRGPALVDYDRKVSRDKRGPIQRPLLEPAIAYFLTVRVPRTVNRVIRQYRMRQE